MSNKIPPSIRLHLFFCIAFTPFFLIPQAEAETRYVSDYLTINIKDNLEKPYQVVAKVKSNEPVNVLEENDTYAKVETEGKQIGWIAKQYLTTTLPKNLVIEQLTKEIESLKAQATAGPSSRTADKLIPSEDQRNKAECERLGVELKAAMTRIAELQNSMAQQGGPNPSEELALMDSDVKLLAEKKQQLESEVHALQVQIESLSDGSIDVQALLKEKEDLVTQLNEKSTMISSLSAENKKLADKAMIYWFCAGALVFVIGMFSAKLFARKKTKYSY